MAAAGGAFAVPLIASFSMDSASAQTTNTLHSSNQTIVSNTFCSNMTAVPSAVFFAELQVYRDGRPGPAVGQATLELVPDRDELFYQLVVLGAVTDFSVTLPPPPSGSFFEVLNGGTTGTVKASALGCGADSLNTVYSGLEAGGAIIGGHLSHGGGHLQGPIIPLGLSDEARNRFSFGPTG